ncbi:MAG: hypothetical protein JWM59_1394 [Verrucomicrobiales bacterium]|nr:hypothetical protein [Verrucomicrobiales bacterium]
MTMPLFSRFRAAASILTLTLLPLAAQADDLAKVLPEDALFFSEVRNLAKLRESAEHPLAKKIRSGELGKLLDKLTAASDTPENRKYNALFKEEAGLSMEEALAKFAGGVAAGLEVPVEKLMADPESARPGGLIVADFTGDEALFKKILSGVQKVATAKAGAAKAEKEKVAAEAKKNKDDDDDADDDDDSSGDKPQAKWPEEYEESITEADGVSIHGWTVKDEEKTMGMKISWAVAGGRLILGIGDVDTKDAVHRQVKDSTEGSLAATAAYKEIDAAAGDWDVLAGANLERGLGLVQESMRKQMEKGELNTGMPVNPLQIWNGLGMDQFRTAFMAWDLQGEVLDFHAAVSYERKPAILKLYTANGPGEPPLFAPSDAMQVSWGTFDWGKMFEQLKELAAAISPVAGGGLEMGMNTLKSKIGVDLHKDVLAHMGDNLWTVAKTLPAEKDAKSAKEKKQDEDEDEALDNAGLKESQLVGIALRDSKAFELSVKSILNAVAPGTAIFDDREYMGNTIREVKDSPPGQRIAWLVKGDTLILSVGEPDLLEKVLAGMDKKPAAPLLEEDFVKSAFASLPDGHVASSYYDTGKMVNALLPTVKTLLENFDDGESPLGDFLESLPDQVDLPFFAVDRSYVSDKSVDVRLRLSQKP